MEQEITDLIIFDLEWKSDKAERKINTSDYPLLKNLKLEDEPIIKKIIELKFKNLDISEDDEFLSFICTIDVFDDIKKILKN